MITAWRSRSASYTRFIAAACGYSAVTCADASFGSHAKRPKSQPTFASERWRRHPRNRREIRIESGHGHGADVRAACPFAVQVWPVAELVVRLGARERRVRPRLVAVVGRDHAENGQGAAALPRFP